MTTRFYTNVALRGSKILLRGFENGKPVQKEVKYQPYMFLPAKDRTKKTKYRTLDGIPVDRIDFDSPKEARDFVKRWEDVENFNVYGFTNFVYTFINDEYNGTIDFDPATIRVGNIDIEVRNKGRSIDDTIVLAVDPISAITVQYKDTFWAFGWGDYKPKDKRVKYYKARDEADLILKFLDLWKTLDLDVVTGWNIEGFDIPFLVRRITNLLGKEYAQRLSPWGVINEKSITGRFGKDQTVYEILGIATLDYMLLYKKFTYTLKESYSLNFIAFDELGEKKLDYSDMEDLYELEEKDYERFMDYNIRDTELVMKLDAKLNLLAQVFTIAYFAHINYVDALTTVRLWDVIYHNMLLNRYGIVVPQFSPGDKQEMIEGAFVMEPEVGMYEWLESFDYDSLYPHLQMTFNISPEKLTGDKLPVTVEDILNGALREQAYRDHLIDNNLTCSGSGYLFKRDGEGFMPEMLREIYDDRKAWKRKMLDAEEEYEKTKNEALQYEIAKCNNMQMALKIILNGAYGAMSNPFFRWYDDRLATSVTLSGQVVLRYMANAVNGYVNKILATEGEKYVIYADTDSIYVRLDKLVEKVYSGKNPTKTQIVDFLHKAGKQKFEPFIAHTTDEIAEYMNAAVNKLKMKREVIVDKGIWTGKKRYILNVWDSEGVRYAEPKLKFKGIEVVKSSTPQVVREKMKQTYKKIMNEDETAVQNFIAEFREEFFTLPFEDIAFPRGCNGLTKYVDSNGIYVKGCPIHVRGAAVYNQLLKDSKLNNRYSVIADGDRIKFCYLRMPNPSFENVISTPGTLPRQLGLDQYIDYNTMYDKSYVEPVKAILDAIGWSVEQPSTLW